MAGLLHAPLLMLTTLMVALNLSLSPTLVHTMQSDTEKFDVQKIGPLKSLQWAVSKYNENSDDLYQNIVVQLTDTDIQLEAAGTKYLFLVTLGQTICLKPEFFADCPLKYPEERTFCFFEVYIEPSKNQISLTTSICDKIGTNNQFYKRHKWKEWTKFLDTSSKCCFRVEDLKGMQLIAMDGVGGTDKAQDL